MAGVDGIQTQQPTEYKDKVQTNAAGGGGEGQYPAQLSVEVEIMLVFVVMFCMNINDPSTIK